MDETSLNKFANVRLFATVFNFVIEYVTWKNYGVENRKVTFTA